MFALEILHCLIQLYVVLAFVQFVQPQWLANRSARQPIGHCFRYITIRRKAELAQVLNLTERQVTCFSKVFSMTYNDFYCTIILFMPCTDGKGISGQIINGNDDYYIYWWRIVVRYIDNADLKARYCELCNFHSLSRKSRCIFIPSNNL